MKYVIIIEGRKPTLANSKAELDRVVVNAEDGPGIICVAWNESTPASVMAQTSEEIIGREKSLSIGLYYLVDKSIPLSEMLWEEFEKALS